MHDSTLHQEPCTCSAGRFVKIRYTVEWGPWICCSHYFEALNLLDSSGLGATEEERSGSSSSPALIRQVDRRAVNQACSSQILRSQRGVKLRFVVGILKRCTFHMFVYTKSAEHASALQPLADSAVPAANSCRATMSSLNTEHDS